MLAEIKKGDPNWKDPGRKFINRVKLKNWREKAVDIKIWAYTQEKKDEAFENAIDTGCTTECLAALLDQGARSVPCRNLPAAINRWDGRMITLIIRQKVEVLLSRRCPQQQVDTLLLTKLGKPDGDITLVKLLLKHDANVSKARGEALQIAYQNGNQKVFKSLLRAYPTKEALGMTLKLGYGILVTTMMSYCPSFWRPNSISRTLMKR